MLKAVCDIVGVARVNLDPHSTFLREPHTCPHTTRVDISNRPLLPTLQQLLELCGKRAGSVEFVWGEGGGEGCSGAGVSGGGLSVAVSASWSCGLLRSAELGSPQVSVCGCGCLCVCVCVWSPVCARIPAHSRKPFWVTFCENLSRKLS